MKPQILIIVAVIVAILTGAGGFFGGMAYAQGQQQSALAAFQAQRGGGQGGAAPNAQGGFPQGGQGFRGGANAALGAPVANGQIKSINGDTVEISTAESVVTVKVNDATQITKTDRGTLADLVVGERVTVFSKETGSAPTASGIQVNALSPASQAAPQSHAPVVTPAP